MGVRIQNKYDLLVQFDDVLSPDFPVRSHGPSFKLSQHTPCPTEDDVPLAVPFPSPTLAKLPQLTFHPGFPIQMCVPRGAGAPSSPDSPTVTVSGLGLPSLVLSEPHTLASIPLPQGNRHDGRWGGLD